MTAKKPTYVFGSFRLNPSSRVLTRNGEVVALTAKVFDTLLVLVRHAGEVISKEAMIQEIWPDTSVEEANLTQNISVLRKALGESRAEHRYIVTVPGRGYQFVAEVNEVSLAADAPAESSRPRWFAAKSAGLLAAFALMLLLAGSTTRFVHSRSHLMSSVAVLPFHNASGDRGLDYLSEGMAESLIDRLCRIPGLKVIARSSSFRYSSRASDLRTVARSLGVDAVVQGDVSHHGNEVEIRVDLEDVVEMRHLWGASFTRKLVDLQDVQKDISRAVAAHLHLRLSEPGSSRLAKHVTTSPEAYRLFLTALFQERRNSTEGTQKALECLRQAVALDPRFALAYASMTDSYSNLASAGLIDSHEALNKAKAAALKAVELDESLAEGHGALAIVKLQEWDWQGAETEFKRATELNENLAGVHSDYSIYLVMLGRFDEAIAENRRSQELAPLSILLKAHEGRILNAARRYDDALQVLRAALEMQPDDPTVHLGLAQAYAGKHRYADAIREYESVLKALASMPAAWIDIACTYSLAGRRAEAMQILSRLNQSSVSPPPTRMAALSAVLGDENGAFDRLEQAYATRDPGLMNLKISPAFDRLRSHPRFQAILHRVGFPS